MYLREQDWHPKYLKLNRQPYPKTHGKRSQMRSFTLKGELMITAFEDWYRKSTDDHKMADINEVAQVGHDLIYHASKIVPKSYLMEHDATSTWSQNEVDAYNARVISTVQHAYQTAINGWFRFKPERTKVVARTVTTPEPWVSPLFVYLGFMTLKVREVDDITERSILLPRWPSSHQPVDGRVYGETVTGEPFSIESPIKQASNDDEPVEWNN